MEEALKTKERIIKAAVFVFVILAISHYLAIVSDMYHKLPWIDIPMHFGGGIFLAILFYWFFYTHKDYINFNRGFIVVLILVISWSAFGGVLWEFGEFLYDLFISHNLYIRPMQLGVRDTLGDLLFDILGGVGVAIYMHLRYHRKQR